MTTEAVIDARFDPVDLLASMMFADEIDSSWIAEGGMRKSSTGAVYEEIDAGSRLLFDSMKPSFAYTFDMIDSDRLVSTSPDYLLAHPSDVIGQSAEVVMLTHDRLKWSGFRRMKKAPRGVWVSSPGASLYEFHYREVFPDGRNTYRRRVAAVGKSGKPVQTAIVGSQGAPAVDGFTEGTMLIMAASVIEDSYRTGAIRCEITDGNTIVAPIPLGAQRPLFSMRDGPLTGRGRRRAILHHVLGHDRTSSAGNAHTVRDHFRGVVEFVIDGLHVRLTANDKRPH